MAAAHDRQEGHRLLVGALFAPVRAGRGASQMVAITALVAATGTQHLTCAAGVGLKMNKSGATLYFQTKNTSI